MITPETRAHFVTEHFRWDEFRSHDGTAVPARLRPNIERLCNLTLEVLRDYWGKPITILSGYRTPAWNSRVKGAAKSQHCQGRAADIVVAGVSPSEVARVIEVKMGNGDIPDGGIGRYLRWTHVDCGPAGRRWRGR